MVGLRDGRDALRVVWDLRRTRWPGSPVDRGRAPVRCPRVALLNALIGLPSDYTRAATFAGPHDADVYLLDYNYRDRDRASTCLAALEVARREHGLSFADKTLLLVAGGLDPLHGSLLGLCAEFAAHHVFFELWNNEQEVAELRAANLANLYFLPVTSALPLRDAPRPMPARPNRRVFASLGGDDDIDLLREVVRARRDLHFFIPDVTWLKGPWGKRVVPVAIGGSNVISVPCRDPELSTFTAAYLLAYTVCDTVLVVTHRDKRHQMRGGIRIADAMLARKRVVMARNGMCELVMAQHEKTCLVAEHDAGEIGAALERMVGGEFRIDAALYEEIRALTRVGPKLAWMVNAPRDPEAARRSAFFRDSARLARELERLSHAGPANPSVPALFGITKHETLGIPGTDAVRIGDIRRLSDERHEITVSRADGRPLELIFSTDPADACFRRTGRGHSLSYRGKVLAPADIVILEHLARLL